MESIDWWFPFIDYVLHNILPNDSKMAASIQQRALDYFIQTNIYNYIVVHILGSCFAAFYRKRHIKLSKKPKMDLVELVNPE